jgi:hypothetical protein
MASIGSKLRRARKGLNTRRFIQLWMNVKRSQAYYSLDVYARAALLELLERYTGINNGMIVLGCRELAEALGCSKDKAASAMRDLDDSDLARIMKPGAWRGKRATEWRLTFYRCDKTGDLPALNWPARQSAGKDTKVRVEGHKPALSPRGRTQKPKSSTIESALSPPRRTHIDIYHTGGEADHVRAPSRQPASPNSIWCVGPNREPVLRFTQAQ